LRALPRFPPNAIEDGVEEVALKSFSLNAKLVRRVAGLGLPLLLAACGAPPATTVSHLAAPVVDPQAASMYAPLEDGGFLVPAVDTRKIDPQFLRQVVTLPYEIPNQPGTIVVDPNNRFLYLVFEGGQALRYGIGVGREGFGWSGDATINAKREWPKWFPPKEMVERDPKAAPYADGMDGGLGNPLGARGLYLYQGKVDTLYRIHGTNEPWSIGHAVSSGCIRMLNQDVIDLYNRVPTGTRVTVLPSAQVPVASAPPTGDGMASIAPL
jgi:lipoprotein-anchoring transpeptidase ErfK/SrfK